jgi:hypothetical protein
MNLPDYHFLPAPLWLLTVLHLLLFTLHLAAMNFLVGGIVVVLGGRFPDRWHHSTVSRYLTLAPTAMAATVTLGVAALLFLQVTYPGPFYSASIVSGWFWLLVIAAAISGYYLLYGAAFHKNSANTRWYVFIALACFLYISLVYSATFAMAERVDIYRRLYAQAQHGWVLNPAVGSYLFRWLHMLTGALTVGGFWFGLLAKEDEKGFQNGKWFFTGGMLLASLFGFLYLVNLGPIIPAFMRSSAIWWLTGSVLLSMGALHLFFKKRFWAAGGMLLISLFGMVYTRHAARLLTLQGYYDPANIKVMPQWSVFGLFLACLILAVGLLVYMLRTFFRAERKGA